MNKADKEYLDLMTKAITAEIQASGDILKGQIKNIIVRQDRANHRTEKLEEYFLKLDERVLNDEKDTLINSKDIGDIQECLDKKDKQVQSKRANTYKQIALIISAASIIITVLLKFI